MIYNDVYCKVLDNDKLTNYLVINCYQLIISKRFLVDIILR